VDHWEDAAEVLRILRLHAQANSAWRGSSAAICTSTAATVAPTLPSVMVLAVSRRGRSFTGPFPNSTGFRSVSSAAREEGERSDCMSPRVPARSTASIERAH
jgi:hypothetical protein